MLKFIKTFLQYYDFSYHDPLVSLCMQDMTSCDHLNSDGILKYVIKY